MADVPQALSIRRIAADEAAHALAGFERMDPSGRAQAGDVAAMCEGGQCFALDGAAQAVYVLRLVNGVVWVDALKGSGSLDVLDVVDTIVSEQSAGARCIAFQTKRPGLKLKLEQRGFTVAGWIMKRDMR